MSVVLDPSAQRRARVRAVAAAVLDQPATLDRFQPTEHPLESSERKRASSNRPVTRTTPGYFSVRRRAAITALAVQAIALACALFLPVFRVSQITITGARLLNQSAVISTAAINGQSIFTVDGDTIRARLLSLPWIRTATVSTELPNRVTISITEWSPTLRMVHANTDMLLADDGAVVNASVAKHTALAAIPLLVDSRSGGGVPPAALVSLLDQTVQRYPVVFGVNVAAFEWQPDGRLAIWSSNGWKAVLGHVDTSNQVASIPGKLATLGALRSVLNLTHPNFGYIDLEAVDSPAVGGKPGLPQNITAALTAPLQPVANTTPAKVPAPALAVQPQPEAKPTKAPTPAPTPVPSPTPTPFVFYLPSSR